jgi:hypothetical protein
MNNRIPHMFIRNEGDGNHVAVKVVKLAVIQK